MDALTTNVDHVADAFDRLASAAPADFICASVQRSAVAFSVTFQYPDGRLVRLDGRRDGCNQVSMQGQPGQARVGASAVLAAYLEALRSQRATLSPPEPTDLPTLRCPAAPANFGPGLLPGERKLDMVEAVVCTYPGAASGSRGSFPLLPAQVRVIDRDYAAHLTRHPAMLFCHYGLGTTALIGETAWGDRVMTSTSCGPWSRAGVPGTPLYWQPSAAASRMLDHAVAGPSSS